MKNDRVEIVTVSESGARMNWLSKGGAQYEAACASAHDKNARAALVDTLNGRHCLAVFDGLEEDTKYSYRISAGGRVAHKGAFRTIARPPGDFSFRFATINDIHIGEEVYGLIMLPGFSGLPVTPGMKMDIGGKPFWQFTNETAIRELNRLELDFIIVKGDMVTDSNEKNIRRSKEMLDTLRHPYYVLRGNHDRPGAAGRDFFAETFDDAGGRRSFMHKGCGFILLDGIHPKSGYTKFTKSLLEWFGSEMERMAGTPVFVFLHNPPLRLIERAPAHRINSFLKIVDSHPSVAGVFYAHTHANKRIMRKGRHGAVPFVETAATMDYPGGYNIYDVYSGGCIQTCVRPHDGPSYKWYERSSSAYYGLVAVKQLGGVEDRNFSWTFNS